MFNKPQTFIFIGRSGSGKGTQADLLKSYLETHDTARSVSYAESGERFRQFIKSDTYSSNLSKEIAERGGLQPEFLAVWNWSTLFVENATGDEHLILDGMPRRLREAYVLDSAIEFYKRDMPLVIHLSVSREWAKKHLMSRMRADDNEQDIENRLAWFDTEVTPIFEYYKRDRRYNFVEINGERSIEEVHKDILETFEKIYGNNN